MTPDQKASRRSSKLLVPVVLTIGLVSGYFLSLLNQAGVDQFSDRRFLSGLEPILRFHIILTTVSVALLISLIVVYVNVYRQTRANFALGLIVVLISLLLQSVTSHPFLLGLIPLGPRSLLPFADIFTIVAYAVFLYLSLE